MGRVDARRVGVVLGLMLSMGLTTIWVQAQEQQPGDATAAAEAVELASGQEAAEAAEQAEQQPPTLTLALAEQFLEAAKAEAIKQGWAMSFAVVDATGRQVALIRMDGARWMTTRVAQAKAFTAATFRRPSAAVEELAEQRPDLFQSLTQLIDEPMLLAGGGLPIIIEGRLLGGVGASGGTEAEDIDCAQAGLDVIGAE
ncbi:MAG: heme-binding protein [Desulfurellaceae bacterium]|nr:heme-binding protein [Desulfurellaceae bacterium]